MEIVKMLDTAYMQIEKEMSYLLNPQKEYSTAYEAGKVAGLTYALAAIEKAERSFDRVKMHEEIFEEICRINSFHDEPVCSCPAYLSLALTTAIFGAAPPMDELEEETNASE